MILRRTVLPRQTDYGNLNASERLQVEFSRCCLGRISQGEQANPLPARSTTNDGLAYPASGWVQAHPHPPQRRHVD
jgi:hypothetical protein